VWGTENASFFFLPTVPLLINFTVTFAKNKKPKPPKNQHLNEEMGT
jgi:hypothetical protein